MLVMDAYWCDANKTHMGLLDFETMYVTSGFRKLRSSVTCKTLCQKGNLPCTGIEGELQKQNVLSSLSQLRLYSYGSFSHPKFSSI
jgi:hypothetical protein